ncbi:hypothetical protein HYU82_00685 [Candidatus Saccharibacteria bacterium]|nr:hypothetical protein [Candidatus Saccharibacteria bacterium]
MISRSLAFLKLKVSLSSAFKVFRRPSYILLATFGVLLSSGLILWSLNLGLVKYILFEAPLNVLQKIDFFFDVYKGIYSTYSGIQGTGIVLFSVLFGVNIALLVYVYKNQGFKSIPKKSGIGGFAIAIIGGGCIACGTSIIAPIVATFGAASTAFLTELSVVLSWLGSLLIAYSIYKLGLICSILLAKSKTNTLQ